MTNGANQIITSTDPVTGEVVQQIVQTVIDPDTGEAKQISLPYSNNHGQVAGASASGQIITTIDPTTGLPTKQLLQTVTDPETGATKQISVPLPDGFQGEPGMPFAQLNGCSGSGQIITTIDPTTGKPTKQLLQTVTDPETGKTKQISVPLPEGFQGESAMHSSQIFTSTDPVTGDTVQYITQSVTDPETGETKEISIPLLNQISHSVELFLKLENII